MFSFAHTEYLLFLLVLVPVALLFFLNRRWKKKTTKKFGDAHLVKFLTANHSSKKFSTKFWLLFFAIAFAAVGAANLRQPGKNESINRKGRDVIIAMDVSKSMLADDIKPTRLEKAKQFVSKLIDALPDDRIGLIWFAGKAYMPMPLTADEGAAKLFVQSASPEAVPTQGTAIGAALQLAAQSFSTEAKRYRIVILITDGEDHDEAAIENAERLKEQGILLIAVGLGTTEGSTIIEPGTTAFKKDKLGQTIISKLNETLLKKMVLANGGMYGNLQNIDAMIQEVSGVVNQLEKKSAEDNGVPTNYYHYFIWFLAVAFLLLLIDIFVSEKKPV